MFATKSGRKYAGAVVDGWKAYNITSDNETGIGAWSDEEIERYLSSGHAPAQGSAGGGMAEAIDLSLRHLSSEDIAALTRYLRTVPPQRSELAARVDHASGPVERRHGLVAGADRDESTGFQVFASACASCHGWDGNGQQTDNAGLRGSRSVNDPAGTNVIRAVLEGIKIGSFGGNNTMPSFAAHIPTKKSPRSATTSSGISAASKATSPRPRFVPPAIETSLEFDLALSRKVRTPR